MLLGRDARLSGGLARQIPLCLVAGGQVLIKQRFLCFWPVAGLLDSFRNVWISLRSSICISIFFACPPSCAEAGIRAADGGEHPGAESQQELRSCAPDAVTYTLEETHMEPENHWVVEENALPKVHATRFHVHLPGCTCPILPSQAEREGSSVVSRVHAEILPGTEKTSCLSLQLVSSWAIFCSDCSIGGRQPGEAFLLGA